MKLHLLVLLVVCLCAPAFRFVRNRSGNRENASQAAVPEDQHVEQAGHEEQEQAKQGARLLLLRSTRKPEESRWQEYFRVPADFFGSQLQRAHQAKDFLQQHMLHDKVVGWLDMGSHPAESLAVAFALLVVVFFFSAKCCTRRAKTEKLREMKALIQAERNKFGSFVEEMLVPLEAIEENSSHVAECRFREKYRTLIHFLRGCLAENNQSTNAILIARYRKFMLLWLKAFEDCTFDPESKPVILCSPSRLNNVERCGDIFARILEEIAGKEPDFVLSQMLSVKEFQEKLKNGKGSPDGQQDSWIESKMQICSLSLQMGEQHLFPLKFHFFCLRIRLNSLWHASMLVLFMYGCGAAIFMHSSARHAIAVAMDVAVCLLAIILADVDNLENHMIMERELNQVKAQKKQVETMLKSVKRWIVKHDRVCMLWKQTLTKLDLMEEMSNAFQSLSSTRDFDLGWDPLREVNEKIEGILRGMGTSREYLNGHFPSDEWLAQSNEQMQESVTKISCAIEAKQWEQMVQCLGNFFGYIKVRIRGACDLQMSDSGFFKAATMPRAYVVGYLGQVGQCDKFKMRTDPGPESCNPQWKKNCEYPVHTEEFMTFEVRSGQDVLGFATLPLREAPGKWVQKRSRLRDMMGKAGKATLDVEYFFGDCITHFIRDCADEETMS